MSEQKRKSFIFMLAILGVFIGGAVTMIAAIANAITEPYLNGWDRVMQGGGAVFLFSFVGLMTYMAVTEFRAYHR